MVKGLEEHGHVRSTSATEGRQGLFLATSATYDVLIVDRMAAGLDGLGARQGVAVWRDSRRRSCSSTTMDQASGQRVEGLEAGGDDYLIKPFAFAELLARIHALGAQADRLAQVETDAAGWRSRDGSDRSEGARGAPATSSCSRANFGCSEYLDAQRRRASSPAPCCCENVWEFHFDPQDQHRRDARQPAALKGGPGVRLRADRDGARARGIASVQLPSFVRGSAFRFSVLHTLTFVALVGLIGAATEVTVTQALERQAQDRVEGEACRPRR